MPFTYASASVWRTTFQNLLRDFRHAAEEHPDLRHAIVQALDEAQSIPPQLQTAMRCASGSSAGAKGARGGRPAETEGDAADRGVVKWNKSGRRRYSIVSPG